MKEKIYRQKAEALLEIHEGSCSVFGGSHLILSFREMEREGKVSIQPCGGSLGMWDIRVKEGE